MSDSKKSSTIVIDAVLISVFVIALIVTIVSGNAKLNSVGELKLGDTNHCTSFTEWTCGSSKVETTRATCDGYKTSPENNSTSWKKLIDYADNRIECSDDYLVNSDFCCRVTTCERKCTHCDSGYHVAGGKCVSDVTSCPEGQGKNSFGACENCAPGYWSEKGNISCATKCPENYACKNGRKVACSVATPEGSSECYTCDVSNCKTCKKYQKDVCETCNKGYKLNASGKCNDASSSSSSNNNSNNSNNNSNNGNSGNNSNGSNSQTSQSSCYKNTANNEYVFGQYSNQNGFTKLFDESKKCNKVLIKLVDDNKKDLQGAVITITSSLNPTSPMTYNIGSKELELLEPGMYTIKETAAPTNYQIDSENVTINVDNNGIVVITSSSTHIDLVNTNSTRNVTIVWQNLLIPTSTPSNEEEDEKEQCYVDHEGDAENNYCFGKKDACSNYSKILEGRDSDSCKEEIACYKTANNGFVSGKYTDREGYKYYAETCPRCYKDKNGNLAWGSFENVEGYAVEANINEADCVTKTNEKISFDKSKLIYIVPIAVILIIILMFSKKKPKKNDPVDEDEEEKEDYNYNYRI